MYLFSNQGKYTYLDVLEVDWLCLNTKYGTINTVVVMSPETKCTR